MPLQWLSKNKAFHCSDTGENNVHPVGAGVVPCMHKQIIDGCPLEFVTSGSRVGNNW